MSADPMSGTRPGWLTRRLDPARASGLYLTLAVVAVAVFGGAFLAIAEDLGIASPALAADTPLVILIHGAASPAVTRVLWIATLLGDTMVMTAHVGIAFGLLAAWGRRREAVVLLVLALAGPLFSSTLKALYGRVRPPAADALLAVPGDASFPSGHSLSSLLLYGALAMFVVLGARTLWPKMAAIAVALVPTLAVGASRVYLGVHWPSDVLASWCLGAAMLSVAGCALVAWDRLVPRESGSTQPLKSSAALWALTIAGGLASVAVVVAEAFRNPLP